MRVLVKFNKNPQSEVKIDQELMDKSSRAKEVAFQKKLLIEHFHDKYPLLLMKHIRSAIDLADNDMVLTNIFLEMKNRSVWGQLEYSYEGFRQRIGVIIRKDNSGNFTCILL